MKEIKIYTEEINIDYFVEYIKGRENYFTIIGNDHYFKHLAEWFIECQQYIDALDYYGDFYSDCTLTEEQEAKVKQMYDEWNGGRYNEFIVKLLNVIHPECKYETTTIRGYTQSEWQEVIYDANQVTNEMIKELESYYFGNVVMLVCTDEENEVLCAYMTDDELWNAEQNGTVRKQVKELFELTDNNFIVYKPHGYVRIPKWEEVE